MVPDRRFWLVLPVLLAGCVGGSKPPAAHPLVDLLDHPETEVVGSPTVTALPRALWRFDAPGTGEPLAGWMNGDGVADLEIRDGRLTGETTSESPIVHVEWQDGLGRRDRLHAVDIELRVSDGTNLEVEFPGGAASSTSTRRCVPTNPGRWRPRCCRAMSFGRTG